jgi:hypothetical protein
VVEIGIEPETLSLPLELSPSLFLSSNLEKNSVSFDLGHALKTGPSLYFSGLKNPTRSPLIS